MPSDGSSNVEITQSERVYTQNLTYLPSITRFLPKGVTVRAELSIYLLFKSA